MIKVFVAQPPGTSCRKLVFMAVLVAEKFGLEVEVNDCNRAEHDGITVPFIMFGDLVLGKDTSLDSLEQAVVGKVYRQEISY